MNSYVYGKDNLLKTFKINDVRSVQYTYDGLNRLLNTSLNTDRNISTNYNYYDSKLAGYSTSKIKEEKIDDVSYGYEYDARGNITRINKVNNDDSTTQLYQYQYDALNELISVYDYVNLKEYEYKYDNGGNIKRETVLYYNTSGVPIKSERHDYTYTDASWGDKLTSYDGQTITYDEIGNPLSYRGGMAMTWKNGRQLATLQSGDNSSSYSYDSNSVRLSKTVNGTKYTYEYLDGKLLYETRGEARFFYSYDSNGILYSVKYTLTDTSDLMTYYFTHNSRGDIIGIYNGAGDLKAHYEYDAWGNVTSITDANGAEITSATHIGNLNPFRYRGYYQDSESGFYYLMSRYYDPVTHRFINADGYFQSGSDVLDTNMHAYCANNPINYAVVKLKERTYPYCKNLTDDFDFLGVVTENKVNITLHLTGPREIFRTKVDGEFVNNENNNVFKATLELSLISKEFIVFINLLLFLILMCFLIFEVGKILVPIALIILLNLMMAFFALLNFNIVKQVLSKIFE